MSEEQVKPADAEAVKEEEEDAVEEISEEDLDGVVGGAYFTGKDLLRTGGEDPLEAPCTCGEENCDCVSCDSEVVSATNVTAD